MILFRPVCWLFGHKRGKLLRVIPAQQGEGMNPNWIPTQNVFVCPRCGRETRYKVKPTPVEPLATKPSSITVQEANAEYIAKRKV